MPVPVRGVALSGLEEFAYTSSKPLLQQGTVLPPCQPNDDIVKAEKKVRKLAEFLFKCQSLAIVIAERENVNRLISRYWRTLSKYNNQIATRNRSSTASSTSTARSVSGSASSSSSITKTKLLIARSNVVEEQLLEIQNRIRGKKIHITT